MGHSEQNTDDAARSRLMQTAKALVLRGDSKFSIASLCKEAGMDRSEFGNHFGGKTALMAALMLSDSVAEPSPETSPKICAVPAAPQMPLAVVPAAREPVSELTPKAEQTTEPSVSTPDAWLERRLRVFERALNTLEAKAEATAREHARTIAQLEERLNGTPLPASGPVTESIPESVPEPVAAPVPEPVSLPATTTTAALVPRLTLVPEPPKTAVTSPPPEPPVHRGELAGVKHDEVPPAG